jgi:hypothetical protein
MSWWLGGSGFTDAPFFEIRPGETLQLPEIAESGILCHLDPGVAIPGFNFAVSLTDREGRPVSSTHVSCGPCGDVPTNLVTFSGLPPGSYLLQLEGPRSDCDSRWVSRWYPGVLRMSEATAIEIRGEAETQEVSWALTLGGTISGRVLAGGEPLPTYLELLLYAAADTASYVCARSSRADDGSMATFRFRGLEDGDYLLKCESPGLTEGAWFPGVSSAAQAETLRVRNLTGPEEITWRRR